MIVSFLDFFDILVHCDMCLENLAISSEQQKFCMTPRVMISPSGFSKD